MSEATIISKARLLSRDFGETFQARVTGDGIIQRFELPRDNVDPVLITVVITHPSGPPTVLVPVNDIEIVSTGEYFLDARGGVITLGLPLPNGDVLTVDGTSYVNIETEDMASYVGSAFNLHIAGRSPVPDMDSLSPTEEYLVAMLASVEILWSMATEASGEIDVLTPEGVNIPASQRFAQIITLIDRLTDHYKELAAAFNVGPYRIVVSTLRRISRTTGRYVPIYIGQEFDDRTYPPTRVLPPIDSGLLDIGEQ